jgi:hypothetical protein
MEIPADEKQTILSGFFFYPKAGVRFIVFRTGISVILTDLPVISTGVPILKLGKIEI